MFQADLTDRESLRGGRIHRLQCFPGQAAPGTEPLHRHRPPAGLRGSAAHLGSDQLGQPAKAERAGHIARVQLGQQGKLLILQPDDRRLGLGHRSQQLGIRRGRKLLDHIFDSIESNADRQAASSTNRFILQG